MGHWLICYQPSNALTTRKNRSAKKPAVTVRGAVQPRGSPKVFQLLKTATCEGNLGDTGDTVSPIHASAASAVAETNTSSQPIPTISKFNVVCKQWRFGAEGKTPSAQLSNPQQTLGGGLDVYLSCGQNSFMKEYIYHQILVKFVSILVSISPNY